METNASMDRVFDLPVAEFAGRVPVIGSLPEYLRGTCYWNGPGRHRRGDFRYRHWLDGDGLVAALTFDRDGAHAACRFVRSEKYLQEETARRPVYRTFGTAFPGDALKRGIGLVSPVNVSVYPFAGTLLAFGEQGLPWELDPVSLETRGLYTFNGQLNEVTPFSAHPKIDGRTGELINFGVSFSSAHPVLNVFRFTAGGGLVYRRRVPMPYPASTHDCAITDRFVAVFISPYLLRMEALLGEGATVMDALSWEPDRGSWVIVLSRETGAEVARVSVGQGYCLHMVNAFEEGGTLTVDYVEYEKPLYPEYQVIPDLFSDTFHGHPVRLRLDVDRREVVDRIDLAYDRSPDFPAHDPAVLGHPYRHFWMLGISASGMPGRKFFDELARVDWGTGETEVCRAPAQCYWGGEPVFVPDPSAPGERGVVVCQMIDAAARTSAVVVVDAFDLAKAPLATVWLPSPVPPLFHSTFHRAED